MKGSPLAGWKPALRDAIRENHPAEAAAWSRVGVPGGLGKNYKIGSWVKLSWVLERD